MLLRMVVSFGLGVAVFCVGLALLWLVRVLLDLTLPLPSDDDTE